MPKYLSDTRPEAQAVLYELMRQAPPWRKMQMVNQLNHQVRVFALAGLRARHPNASDAELRRRLADILLGTELAEKAYGPLVPELLRDQQDSPLPSYQSTLMNEEVIDVTLRVVATLEAMNIAYVVGGSLAGVMYGMNRTTNDADIVADILLEHAPHLIQQWKDEFYISADALLDAIDHHSTFNLIHLATMYKVDIFIPKPRAFDAAQLINGRRSKLIADSVQEVVVASAEDTVLAKLEWHQLGEQTSGRQWEDILTILKHKGLQLDLEYMRSMAMELEVTNLLMRALSEAGIEPSAD